MSTPLRALAFVLLPQLLLASEKLVLEGAQIVPMDRETVLEKMTIVVEDGRITALGKSDRLAVPPDAERIDARGRYVLPGLIEMHVHIREPSALGLYLAHGFTTVRDMNGRLGDTLGWRRDVEAGKLAGPHIVAGGVTLYGGRPKTIPIPSRPRRRRAARCGT